MSVISMSQFKADKYNENVVSLGDRIKWYDPIFDEMHEGTVTDIKHAYYDVSWDRVDFNVEDKKNFWLQLDIGQTMTADLFVEKAS